MMEQVYGSEVKETRDELCFRFELVLKMKISRREEVAKLMQNERECMSVDSYEYQKRLRCYVIDEEIVLS